MTCENCEIQASVPHKLFHWSHAHSFICWAWLLSHSDSRVSRFDGDCVAQRAGYIYYLALTASLPACSPEEQTDRRKARG